MEEDFSAGGPGIALIDEAETDVGAARVFLTEATAKRKA
jgi:hypothetical protein